MNRLQKVQIQPGCGEKEANEAGRNAGEVCMDYGEKNHARGDLKCYHPSFVTLKIQEDKNGREE